MNLVSVAFRPQVHKSINKDFRRRKRCKKRKKRLLVQIEGAGKRVVGREK